MKENTLNSKSHRIETGKLWVLFLILHFHPISNIFRKSPSKFLWMSRVATSNPHVGTSVCGFVIRVNFWIIKGKKMKSKLIKNLYLIKYVQRVKYTSNNSKQNNNSFQYQQLKLSQTISLK